MEKDKKIWKVMHVFQSLILVVLRCNKSHPKYRYTIEIWSENSKNFLLKSNWVFCQVNTQHLLFWLQVGIVFRFRNLLETHGHRLHEEKKKHDKYFALYERLVQLTKIIELDIKYWTGSKALKTLFLHSSSIDMLQENDWIKIPTQLFRTLLSSNWYVGRKMIEWR